MILLKGMKGKKHSNKTLTIIDLSDSVTLYNANVSNSLLIGLFKTA